MVENVEGLKPDGKGQALMDGEAAAECCVYSDVVRGQEGVAPKITEGAGSILREGGFIQEGEVSAAFCVILRFV